MLSLYFIFHLSCWSHCPLETSKICNTMEPRNWILFLVFHHHPVYPYHWKGPQKVLLCFWPVLWKAAQFCLDTDFEMLWWFLICVSVLAPGADLSRHRKTAHSFMGCSCPHTGPVGSEKAASQDFTLGHQDLFFYFFVIRMTLELKDTFQARLLILRNWSLMRGRNLSLPN